MLPRERDDRVRPIPINDDDAATELAPVTDGASRPARRPLAGLMMLTLVAIVAAVALTSWGSLRDDASADESLEGRSTSSHLGPDDQLLLVAERTEVQWETTWDRLQPPQTTTGLIGLIPAPRSSEAASRSIDASGTVLADSICRAGTCVIGLFAREAPLDRIATIDGDAFAWHEEDPFRIAWTTGSGAVAEIRSGILDPDSGTIDGIESHGSVGANDRLARWDANGFILTGTGTQAIDGDGAPMWSVDANILDLSGGMVAITRGPGSWAVLDRVSGTALMAATPGQDAISVTDVDEGRRRVTVANDGYRYTIAATTPSDAVRTASIGSVPGTTFRIYRDDEGTRLTIVVERAEDGIVPLSFG
jgi:hypothetical protein